MLILFLPFLGAECWLSTLATAVPPLASPFYWAGTFVAHMLSPQRSPTLGKRARLGCNMPGDWISWWHWHAVHAHAVASMSWWLQRCCKGLAGCYAFYGILAYSCIFALPLRYYCTSDPMTYNFLLLLVVLLGSGPDAPVECKSILSVITTVCIFQPMGCWCAWRDETSFSFLQACLPFDFLSFWLEKRWSLYNA